MDNRRFTTLIGILLFSLMIQAQVYNELDGTITFFSEAPLEDIKAENNKVGSVLNINGNKIVFKVAIKDFDFPNELMEDHFNENYMESEKYPHAEFRGSFDNPENLDLSSNEKQSLKITGELTIHGVTNPISTFAELKPKGNKIEGSAVFRVTLEDYDIKVPKMMFRKIAETIEVKVDVLYDFYEKK